MQKLLVSELEACLFFSGSRILLFYCVGGREIKREASSPKSAKGPSSHTAPLAQVINGDHQLLNDTADGHKVRQGKCKTVSPVARILFQAPANIFLKADIQTQLDFY